MGFLVRPMSLPSTLPLTRHLLFVDGKKSACQAAKNGSMRLIRKIVKIQLTGFKKGRPIVSQPVIPQKAQIVSRNVKLKLSLLQAKRTTALN